MPKVSNKTSPWDISRSPRQSPNREAMTYAAAIEGSVGIPAEAEGHLYGTGQDILDPGFKPDPGILCTDTGSPRQDMSPPKDAKHAGIQEPVRKFSVRNHGDDPGSGSY